MVFENPRSPMTQPEPKIIMTTKLNSFMDSRIKVYLPNSNRIKLPDIPGSIMAQIAIAPDKKMNHRVSGVETGLRLVIIRAKYNTRYAGHICEKGVCVYLFYDHHGGSSN